jgi:molybdopterin converting factor small subunit
MSIEVHLPPFFQQLAGGVRTVNISGSTAAECLEGIAAEYPRLKERIFDKRGKLMSGLNVFVNGENVLPGELARPVKDGDTIHLASLVFGG